MTKKSFSISNWVPKKKSKTSFINRKRRAIDRIGSKQNEWIFKIKVAMVAMLLMLLVK